MLFFILILNVGISSATVSYCNYSYDYWGNKRAAPQAYIPSREIGGKELGIGKFDNPLQPLGLDSGL